MLHPSNRESAPANVCKAPRLPRSLEDKLNAYHDVIEDSDEERVVEFTGPRSGRFLPLWHHVHEKSYSRKKTISEMHKKINKLQQKKRVLEEEVARLTPRVGQRTQKVCNFINPERIRSWLD